MARLPRPSVRRAVLALPSGLTLGNLFFGIFAIVSASRGEFGFAVKCVVFGGICDALDGRVARATRSGSAFGEELDSLVDAISFGFAPAMIIYFSVLNRDGWAWLFVFVYTACAVIRLARFNVTQAGESKTHFIGLPSPAAGGTLATYYWFSQSPLYVQTPVGDLPWDKMVPWLMGGLAILMISDVSYPAWPKIGFRTLKGLAGLAVVLIIVFGIIFFRSEFFFPFGIVYIAFGLGKDFIIGLLERAPSRGGRFTGTDRAEVDVAVPPRAPTPRSMGTVGPRAGTPRNVPLQAPPVGLDDADEYADDEAAELTADVADTTGALAGDDAVRRRRRRRRRGGQGGTPRATPPASDE